MGDGPLRVLLVEDDEDDYLLTRDLLGATQGGRFLLDWEPDPGAALDAMVGRSHDAYLIDYRLGSRSGLDLIGEAIERGCAAPLILLTGQGDREIDLEAMRRGAADYLAKGDLSADLLERSIRYAVERKRTEEALRQARAELEGRVRERTAELAEANAELRRRVEELDRAREAAESASRAKDTLLAIVSHELRTPLTPALFATTALLAQDDLEPNLRDLLGTVEENIRVEIRLIDDLLDATRIGRGKMAYAFEVVDVHDLIRWSLEACGPQFGERPLEVATDLAARNPVVQGDAARLRQVFCNLIGNAVKFTPAGGRLEIATHDAGPRLRVSVRDTGIGIAPELLPKLFDAFAQGESTAIRQYGGLGLGLAISKAIVEAHGGRLEARSEGAGKGAEFTVDLGVIEGMSEPEDEAGEPGQSGENGGGDRLRIFYVEDDPMTGLVFLKLLRRAGYEVRHAGSYREAIEAADGAFDLVLSDIALPDGSGWDVMRHIHARWDHVPGIALSGFDSEEDRAMSRAAGFAEHLSKPIRYDELTAAIRRILEQQDGRGRKR